MAVIDTLKLARALRDKGGFSQDAAEATAEALDNALGAAAASKADLARIEHRIEQLGADLRKEMAEVKAEILKWMFGQTVVILAVVGALHFIK